jgi:hypothetical protein
VLVAERHSFAFTVPDGDKLRLTAVCARVMTKEGRIGNSAKLLCCGDITHRA